MVFHCRIHLSRKINFKSSHLRYASKTYSQYQVVVKLLGSFRLAAGNRHLHRYCIFTELFSETVAQSLHYSCASELHARFARSIDTNYELMRMILITANNAIPLCFRKGIDYIFISRNFLERRRIIVIFRKVNFVSLSSSRIAGIQSLRGHIKSKLKNQSEK